MEISGRVRRAVRVEGRNQRAVAREFCLSRETVRKMLQYAVPPDYQRHCSGPAFRNKPCLMNRSVKSRFLFCLDERFPELGLDQIGQDLHGRFT